MEKKSEILGSGGERGGRGAMRMQPHFGRRRGVREGEEEGPVNKANENPANPGSECCTRTWGRV